MPLLRVMAGSRSFGALLAAFILAACVHALCAQFIRAEGHTTLYAVQGLLNTALYIALNVLFLTVFCWGVVSGSRQALDQRNTQIRRARQTGVSVEELACWYCLSPSAIRKILSQKEKPGP